MFIPITITLPTPIDIDLEESDDIDETLFTNDEYGITIRKIKSNDLIEIDDLPNNSPFTKSDLLKAISETSINPPDNDN